MKLLSKIRTLGLRESIKLIMRWFLMEKMFSFFERLGLHVMPVHYYSPVPDTRALRKNLHQWYKEWSFKGVNFNLNGQLELLEQLNVYKTECDNLTPYKDVAAHGLGEGFGVVESKILHAMIRHFKPRNLIEVGSGVSTYYSANAMNMNKKEQGTGSQIYCIEPFPRQPLFRIISGSEIQILPKFVQDVDTSFFNKLDKGDILFIDSSHVVRINSDVNYLYLEVLPMLKEGVLVHIHDIPFPYPTSNPDFWIFKKHLFWTEAAFVHAFLKYNSAFKILLCSSFLHFKMPEKLSSVFSDYDPNIHFPSSLWLLKTGP